MESYLERVVYGAGVNLAFLLPFIALAFLTSGKGRSAVKPVLLFAALFVLDMACIWLFKWVEFIPGWGHYNWQGKVLEAGWPVLLALTVPMFSAGRTGLAFRIRAGSWRAFFVLCGVYVIVMVPFLLYQAGWHPKFAADLPSYAYEATMPGLGEEFVYRGVFLMLLNEAFGRPWKFAGIQFGWGFVIVTAMFGFLHGIDAQGPGHVHIYWSGMIFPAIIGVLLAWLKERSGSVWPGVVFHNFVNTINTIFG